MMHVPAVLSLSAGALLAALGLFHIGRGRRGVQKTYFILSCLVLAAFQGSLGAMLLSTSPGGVLLTFRFFLIFVIFSPVFGIPFFLFFGRRDESEILARRRKWIVLFSILLGAAAVAVPPESIVREIHFSEGMFWGMTVTGYGKLLGVYLLLANVFCLFLLENMYRCASVAGKVTLKYPILGILTVTVLTFVVISRVLAISTVDRNFLAFHSCSLIALCASFFFAALRYRLFDVQAYIGRDVVASVFAITISGLYFLALAVIAFFARLLGVPFDRFTLNVLGLFAVFLLLAILISGRTKRRIRLFIEANFYASKYDYRKEWKRYSSLMGSSETIEEFLSNFISLLCETMMIEQGVVWVDVKGGKFDFYGFGEGKPSFPPFQEVSERMGRESVVLFKDGPRARDPLGDEEADRKGEHDLGWIRAIAAIGDRENRLGLVLLGAKCMDLKYTEEDQEFLATLSDQATLTLENLLIKEQIIDAQQMESFNRFSSFVIHDLKNAIGMLSLTAENAKENINDPVFQKDALDTIERSVEKMKGLIHSLGILKTPTEISKRREDIAGIVRKTLSDLEAVADSRGNQLAFNATGRVYGEVDASALGRIVENLVMNALDASGQGGQVSVSISPDGEEWIEISVEDSGKGFDPDFLRENLFRPFRSTKKGGLGIGLVMCKALVSAHGGDISIRSEPGHGAIVTVRLPAFSRSAV